MRIENLAKENRDYRQKKEKRKKKKLKQFEKRVYEDGKSHDKIRNL